MKEKSIVPILGKGKYIVQNKHRFGVYRQSRHELLKSAYNKVMSTYFSEFSAPFNGVGFMQGIKT